MIIIWHFKEITIILPLLWEQMQQKNLELNTQYRISQPQTQVWSESI